MEERLKASISAKVEHPCLDVKGRFGYAKVRYRGLAKNRERVALLLAFQPKEIPTLAGGRLKQGVVGPEPSRKPKKVGKARKPPPKASNQSAEALTEPPTNPRSWLSLRCSEVPWYYNDALIGEVIPARKLYLAQCRCNFSMIADS